MTRFPPRIKLLLEDAQLHMTLLTTENFISAVWVPSLFSYL